MYTAQLWPEINVARVCTSGSVLNCSDCRHFSPFQTYRVTRKWRTRVMSGLDPSLFFETLGCFDWVWHPGAALSVQS